MSPYHQRLERELANIRHRRVVLRQQIRDLAKGIGTGDLIDRRRALEAGEMMLRAADREYEDVMIKLGRQDELGRPPVRLIPASTSRVKTTPRADLATALRRRGVSETGYITKVMRSD